MAALTAVLFDVDGTLVDTNYQHVQAWWQAFRHGGYEVTAADIHRAVGQGSDQLVSGLLGHDDDAVVRAHSSFYAPWLEQLAAFPGAADLLRAAHDRGHVVVLATSASPGEADRLQEAIGAGDVVSAVTTKGDVEATKPAPDIVRAALDAAGVAADAAVFVGDTVWDVQAGGRCGVPVVGVLSGGIGEAELRDAGAVAVFRDVRHLLDELDSSPLGSLAA